jgi:beta-lactamase regulating signal transducer with metallopeptidase domain
VLPAAALLVPPQVTIHPRVGAAFVASAPVSAVSARPVLPTATASSWNIGAKDVAMALFAFWLAGFGWSVLRLLIGAIGVNALQMSSKPIADRPGLADLDGCDLRMADDQSGPMTWGALQPVILLPSGALEWPPERLRTVLLHELAHVRRLDSLAQTLSRIACALYWPNPLAWIGGRAMRREAEIAADDAVIGAGVRPSLYANELLRLATAYRGAQVAPGAGLSMAAKSALEARVKSILGGDTLRKGVTRMDIAKIAGAGLLATAAFAFVRPSLAEDAPPIPAMPPVATMAGNVPRGPLAPMAVIAENDGPPAPRAPDAPSSPPSPPNAVVPRTLPEPDSEIHGPVYLHGDMERTMNDAHTAMRPMTPEERRKLHAILHNLHHEIRDAMAKASPEMRHAMAELQVHREELKALRPQIEQAMRNAGPQIEQAIEEARKATANANLDDRLRHHVEKAMRQVEKMHLEADRASHQDDLNGDNGVHVHHHAAHQIDDQAPDADDQDDNP